MSEEEPVAEITLDSLQKVDVFDGLSTESLLQIKQKMQAKQYSRGAYIVKVGDPATEMFFIAEGQVEYVDASYKVFSHSSAGDVFGELGLLYSIPRTANVRAATSVRLLVLQKSDFIEIREQNPMINKKIEAIATQRFNNFKYELVKLAFLPADETFTQSQISSFREVFYIYSNADGLLSESELGKMLGDLSGKEFSQDEVKAVLRSLDADRDGSVSFQDFFAKIRTLKWLLDPKDTVELALQIQTELDDEERKSLLWPDFDAPSFVLGVAIGFGLVAAVGFIAHNKLED